MPKTRGIPVLTSRKRELRSMSKILLYGAGKSATVLIDYLVVQCSRLKIGLEVVDAFPELAKQKLLEACRLASVPEAVFQANCYSIDSEEERSASISSASLVISLLPPHLHAVVAAVCLSLQKSLFTASYLDDTVLSVQDEIASKGLLFLYEMGLDPGIDHMSLLLLLDQIRQRGGRPTEIHSHCGGLVAPTSDDNIWHYKISWNPKNVVMAGKAGAKYLEDGTIQTRTHAQLFETLNLVEVPGAGPLAYYPNRDSLRYLDLYGMSEMRTFLRTTLRHPDFIQGWHELVRLGMTDDERRIDLSPQISLAEALVKCCPLNDSLSPDLRDLLNDLGWADRDTRVPFSQVTPAQLLQFCMENKWVLKPADKDRIVMLHEIEYLQQSKKKKIRSWFIQDGEDSVRTAMAKTVGLPLGIAAIQYVTGKIQVRGLRIPTLPEIYLPVLEALKEYGIDFQESEG
ncbi:MAG: saccharopine dehydrogenase [Bacteroidetes bacterium]|nr:saccharopine dehydrogenase [Bacteroidota bacterium]